LSPHPADCEPALKGITVLDLTRLLPGAIATQYFVDHGAEVIKIEQPGTGDYGRTLSPAIFARTNLGKKSVALDLKHAFHKEVFLTLVKRADILVEGNRPGVMDRLGLGYSTLHGLNPRLIYVSITGYGQTGPYAQMAGHDINYIGIGGLLGLNLPVIPGVQIADLVGGSMQTIMGALLALQGRHATGMGRYVDVSMTAGVRSLLVVPLSGSGDLLNGTFACYNIYEAKDGRWLAVGALEQKFWAELCNALGCSELISLQYELDRQGEVKSRLTAIFASRNAAEWFDGLRDKDCCVTPVLGLDEIPRMEDSRRPPELGEHNTEFGVERSG
jgi:crotonobetainyl-CoA:carnitine CoA-transferase CaiB-like acyl-CoA transferase